MAHLSGPHFRDYHLLLDEHGDQIFVTTDAIAERVRKIGGTSLRSIGHIGRLQRVLDNDADFVTPSCANASNGAQNAWLGSSSAPVSSSNYLIDGRLIVPSNQVCRARSEKESDHT